MTRILAILGLFVLPAVVWADDQTRAPAKSYSIKQSLDLAYANGGTRNKLDVFAPKGDKGERFPVVLLVHGGTWMYGDKDFYGLYRKAGKNLATQGVVAVVINYRLSPLVRHPEHCRDVARAFAWVQKNIDQHGGDPDRVILAGHSAGAHLAALVATDAGYLKDAKLKLTERQRKGLKGVVCLSGMYRLPRDDEFKLMLAPIIRNLIGESRDSPVARTLTPMLFVVGEKLNPFPWIFGDDPDVCKQASPLNQVRKGLPPFLLLTAGREVPRLRAMAEEFESALKKCGTDVTYKDLDDWTHQSLMTCLHASDNEVSKLVLDFVAKHAGKPEKAKK
jgi:acetyl esterase/lipase